MAVLSIPVDVDYGQGSERVVVGPVGIIAWERKTGSKVANLQDGVGLDDLAFMAHAQLLRAGRPVPKDYEDFVQELVSIGAEDDEAEPDPTPPPRRARRSG